MPDNTSAAIEFALFAPNNEQAFVAGNWNDWQRQPMNKGKDGWWRISINLADGDYLYKFVVKSISYFARDQLLYVFDPYALSITDDADENTHLRIRKGKRAWLDYEWKHDNVPLPRNEELVIYELHIGDFSGGKGDEAGKRPKGTFNAAVEKLNYLKDLGINAIEVMPIKEFPARGWGYSLRSLFAVDSGYGTPVEFCRFVDECHANGIRLIVDGVYNHAEADCPLAKIDYEYWFYRNNPDPESMRWGPKFDYGKYDERLDVFPARKYVLESIGEWVKDFHIDGIRFDATRAIGDFKVMREFTDIAFKMVDGRKPFFTVAEHVPEDPAITGYPDAGPMVAAWHESLSSQLQALTAQHERDGAKPWDLDSLEQKINPASNGFGSGNRVVNYLVSHDQQRIMRQIGEYTHTFGEAAFRRVRLGTAILLTIPGLPMLWMGQEFGVSNSKSLQPQPIDWALLANPTNKGLHDYTKKLIHLRKSHPALSTDNFQVVLKDRQRALFAYKRWNGAGEVLVIVANLRDQNAGEFVIADVGLEDGDWHEEVNNYDVKISGGVLKDALGASEVKIFAKK